MPERSRAQIALGNAIKRVRLRRGLTQEELADRSNSHRTYVSGIECGDRNPSYRKLNQVAAALDLRLSELLADAERDGPPE